MKKDVVLALLAQLNEEQCPPTGIDKRFWLNVAYIARKALSKGE